MQKIDVEHGDMYPDIILDKENGIFEINGISIPENAREFYTPVLDFLEEYNRDPNEVTHFVFNFRYFNISSSKMILYIIYKLRELHNSGKKVLITWCYDDDDILEAGNDFEQMSKMEFEFREMF